MLKFREYCRIIDEGREEDDAYYRSQGWDGTPEDREWYAETRRKSTSEWTLVAAVKDILGDSVAVEWNNMRPPTGKQLKPGKIYIVPNIRSGGRSAFIPNSPPKAKKGKPAPEPVAPGGIIFVPKVILGRNSDDLAITVHEAYHAKLYMKAGGIGQFHGNEKVVNDLAEKWLKAHLKGFNVQVAMDMIGVSRKGY